MVPRAVASGLTVLFMMVASVIAAASHVVLFTDGRTLRVDRIDRQDDLAVLTLEGGGSIAVPASRVANWWELEEKAPRRTESPAGATWSTCSTPIPGNTSASR